MVYRVKNRKSVIVPGEAIPDNVVSPLEHNTSSDETPKATIALPPVLGAAMIESEKTEKHWAEVTKDLQARADDAAPREKEMDKIDVVAAGKERDYDYTHPVVDNIYTGKLILDESYRPLREYDGDDDEEDEKEYRKIRDRERADMLSQDAKSREKVDPNSKHIKINFNSDDVQFDTMVYLTIPGAEGMTNEAGGIYPDATFGGSNKTDIEDNKLLISQLQSDDEATRALAYSSEEFKKTFDKVFEKIFKKTKASIESDINTDELEAKASAMAKENEIEAFKKTWAYANADNPDDELASHMENYAKSKLYKVDLRKYYNGLLAKVSNIDIEPIREEAIKVATAAVIEKLQKEIDASTDSDADKRSYSGIAYAEKGSIKVNGQNCGWKIITIDGAVLSPKTVTFGAGEMLKRNPWMKEPDVDFTEGEVLCEKGKPLGTKFALEYLMAHDFKWVRESPAGKDALYIAKNPYIFAQNGDKVDIYIAYGYCQFDATEEQIRSIKKANDASDAHKHDSALKTITITIE